MVLEPGVTEDHVLLPKVRDGEECPFGVGLITEDHIYHFGDLSCFVREPSTLNTGMGQEMLRVLIPLVRTKSLSMKLPVVPESKSALTEYTLLVSVVPISIGRMIDVPRASRVLAESCLGSLFSHLGLRSKAVLTGGEGEKGGMSIGSQTSVLTSSTSNTANLLTSGDQGALFAGRVKQNPPLGKSQLSYSGNMIIM